jgi:two-component system, LytTR family, sensor kinase
MDASCARMPLMATEDRLRFPSFWQLQIMGGVCLYVVVLVANVPDLFRKPGTFRANTLVVIFMFLGSLVLRPICRPLVTHSTSWFSFGLRMALWSTIVAIVSSVATELAVLGFVKFDWTDLAPNSVQFGAVLYLWCSLYFSIKQWQRSVEERDRLLRAESEAREARLSALRYQLNPHFLFNSLNAASTLMLEGDAPAATRMLAQIGDLLRITLDHDALPETPLAEELAFVDRYLAIEQTRLGNRLRVARKIPEDTLDAIVPSMLLQPLVENAVRHGVAPLIEGGTIRIESWLNAGRLLITVSNSGPRRTDVGGSSNASDGRPFDAKGSGSHANGKSRGIGLRNTQQRLRTLYGDDHQFSLRWPEEGGCEARIELPMRKASPAGEVVCAR